MALGGRNVIRFWNLSNLDAGIPSLDLPMAEQVNFVVFAPDGRSLIASTDSGLVRIHIGNRPGPVDPHGRATMQRNIDPVIEKILSLPGHDAGQIQFSPDGKSVALAQWRQEPQLINLQDPSRITRLAGASLYTSYVSWSPDGKWLATGNWRSNGGPSATIWDANIGQRILDLPILLDSTVAFSPDNRWLVTCTADEYRFWQVGSWKPDHAVPRKADSAAYIIFAPDSRTLAISTSQLGCKLVEADTGAEVATFDDHGEGLPVGFSPDGNLLITSCQNAPAGPTLRVWELDKIRKELKEMKLDWSARDPPSPQAPVTIDLTLRNLP
jgi:WD40 repeat protein